MAPSFNTNQDIKITCERNQSSTTGMPRWACNAGTPGVHAGMLITIKCECHIYLSFLEASDLCRGVQSCEYVIN